MPYDQALLDATATWDDTWSPGVAGGWVTNGAGQLGWFKATGTPHLAVDFLGTTLARGLGLRTQPSGFATIGGVDGFYCLEAPKPYAKWEQLPSQHHNASPRTFLTNPDDLIGMFVIDVWLGNTDRHGGNLVIHDVGADRWEVILIDFGHCFSGTTWLNGGYTHAGPNLQAASFHRPDAQSLAHALREVVVDCPPVQAATAAVAAASDGFLDALVDLVPTAHIDDARRQVMKDLLKQRRNDVGTITATWWQP